MKDMQLALSAATFLSECDPQENISRVDLRRFKCYETTAIVSYARPFSDSKGDFPKLSLKMIGVTLSAEHKVIHDEIINLRNKVFAHSDSELMRMAVKLHEIGLGDGFVTPLINTAFDEGLHFIGFQRVNEMITLFNIVYDGIYRTLFNDARENPEKFDVHHDRLFPRK